MSDNELKMCERFKEIRKYLKMKQGDFAKEIKLTQGHVSDIENKRKGVSDRVIEIICLKYSINEEWFREGKGKMLSDKDLDYGAICGKIGVSDPKAKQAIINYWHLSEEDKELFIKFVEKFMN